MPSNGKCCGLTSTAARSISSRSRQWIHVCILTWRFSRAWIRKNGGFENPTKATWSIWSRPRQWIHLCVFTCYFQGPSKNPDRNHGIYDIRREVRPVISLVTRPLFNVIAWNCEHSIFIYGLAFETQREVNSRELEWRTKTPNTYFHLFH